MFWRKKTIEASKKRIILGNLANNTKIIEEIFNKSLDISFVDSSLLEQKELDELEELKFQMTNSITKLSSQINSLSKEYTKMKVK